MSEVLENAAASWPEVFVSDVSELIRGVTYSKEHATDKPQDGYTPVLRATNIQESRLVLESDLVFVPDSNVSANQRLRAGDIVVATSSGSKHLVGKSGLVHADWRGSFGAFCAAIRPKANIESRFLAAFLQSPSYWKQVGKKALGVNINNLRRGDIESLTLPLPPLAKQREIVAELEKQFSRLDEAVANLQRVKANLKRYKASVLKASVEGRLVETEATLARREGRTYETGGQLLRRILEERREKWTGKGKYKEPVRAELAAGLLAPDGWVQVSWETVLAPSDGAFKRGPFGSALTKAIFVSSGYKVYEQYCPINDDCSFARYYITPAKFEELKGFAVQAGDYLISCSGVTLGRITRVPEKFETGVINQALLRVRLNSSVIDHRYFLHLFRGPLFQGQIFEQSAGAAIPNVRGVNELKAMPIPLPPLAEQQRIADEVDRHLSIIREVEAEVDANLQRAQALRQSTLAKAFGDS